MERKEAIEIVRKLYNDSLFLKKDMEAMVTLIPELKESEDEKVRKGLIAIITDFDSLYLQENYSLSREDTIAWLEKQGEKKPILDVEIPFGTDSELIEETITIPDGCYAIIEDNKVILHKGEKKPAWSEEDEYAIRWIRTICNDFVKSYKISPASTKVVQKRVDKIESWLNTIKDRVGCEAICTTTREWNEEDEKMKDAIYSCVDSHYDGLAKTSLLIWLKSLRPQSHWRPSDEQIAALKDALNDAIWQYDYKGSMIKEEITRKHTETIESLYNDLKKLKE